MQYAPHALLNCVAWFSLLAYGNAARGVVPSEVLSHFAHTIGTVLVPSLANEIHGGRTNRSATQKQQVQSRATETAQRRQLDTRQASPEDSGNSGIGPGPAVLGNLGQGIAGSNGFNFQSQQAFGPYQYERALQFRHPGFNQQFQQNFFPGGGTSFNGLPIDPRFFQQQAGVNAGLAPVNSDGLKPLSSNLNVNGNNNLKNNANAGQNLDTSNVDSKSSAQNRPFDAQDFSTVPVSPNQGPGGIGPGLDPSIGNLRVNNRFAAIDYERVRQNYYSDPPINQQRDYFSFNEIPFSSRGGGPPFRSQVGDRYSNLNYNSAGGQQGGGSSGDLRNGPGGDPYFGSFLQGPYQNLGYNSLPGGGGGGGGSTGGGAPFSDDFDRDGGPSNFRSPFGLGSQYPSGFNGAFFPGAGGNGGGGFEGGDSSLRASASKESVSQTSRNAAKERDIVGVGEVANRERADREEKVQYVSANGKGAEKKEESTTGGRA